MDKSFLMIFDLISLGCGVYILYTAVKLHMAARLFPNKLLVPEGRSPKDCLDAPAYMQYIKPRLFVVGALVTLFGLVSLVNEYVELMSLTVSLSLTGVMLAILIWYGVCSAKANRKYW